MSGDGYNLDHLDDRMKLSWFDRFFRGKNLKVYIEGNGFLSVPEIDFFGPFSESNNRRFIVAWSDFDSTSKTGGFRQSGRGTFILAEHEKIIFTGRAERPNDGKVADNGTFIINDLMFGEGCKSTFWAFDKQGDQIIKHLFPASLFNYGISCNGEYAVCQLCNNDTENGGVLSFFDLKTKRLLWKEVPDTGWAREYKFDIQKGLLTLCYEEIGEFVYGFDGHLRDRKRWEKVWFARASGFDLHSWVKEQLEQMEHAENQTELLNFVDLLQTALQRGLEQYPNEQASIYRTMGEVNEKLCRPRLALESYEIALSINPKIGLKRKIAALKTEEG